MNQSEPLFERRRNACFREMLPLAQVAAVSVDNKRRRLRRAASLVQYDTGRGLLPILADPKTYGATAFDQIAEYLGIEDDRLQTYIDVADAFDRDFIERESQIQMACGRYLDIAYFAELVPLRNDEEQIALALWHIREDNLSLAKVHRLVRRVLLGHRLTEHDS